MSPDELEVLEAEPTSLGLICLQQRGHPSDPSSLVTEITLDHEFLMSSHSTVSEEALAAEGLALCSGERLSVLVGGLGLGFTARACLRDPRVERLEVVEFLQPVLRWHAEGRVPLGRELHGDARFHARRGDVYAELAEPGRARFDAILVDVDHSPDESLGSSSHSFHTVPGLRAAHEHLRPGGVLGIWSYAESPRFSAALGEVFGRTHTRRLDFHNPVIEHAEINWLYFGLRQPPAGPA